VLQFVLAGCCFDSMAHIIDGLFFSYTYTCIVFTYVDVKFTMLWNSLAIFRPLNSNYQYEYYDIMVWTTARV